LNTRQEDIINLLEIHGEVSIRELAEKMNVSEMTIHRDLDYLEEMKYLYKKRGAAVYVNKPDRDKSTFYSDEKTRIGKKVTEFVKPGQSVIFDNSTTSFEAAKFLRDMSDMTFYTTNTEITQVLSGGRSIVYCSGGYYFPETGGFVGEKAEEFVDGITADICVIGASGISLEKGITNPYPMHTRLQKKIMNSAKYKILVADHSKFDKVAVENCGYLEDIDLIITDSGISEDVLERYKEKVKIEVV